jgi:hypothetical protein
MSESSLGFTRLFQAYSELRLPPYLMQIQLTHERPEQELLGKFLPPAATVLEIGGGQGCTAILIDKLLTPEYRAKHIVIEPGLDSYQTVLARKQQSGSSFQLIHGFLARNREFQEALWEECKTCPNVLLEDIASYPIDVIAADCEGAFQGILQDFPELLQQVKLIFLENDHPNCKDTQELLRQSGFICIHTQVHPYVGSHHMPFATIQELHALLQTTQGFHQVWLKKDLNT